MGFYDNKNVQKPSAGGVKPVEGFYPQVKIIKTHINPGFHGLYFVTEFEILDNGGNPSLTPVGARASWTRKLDGPYGHLGEGDSYVFLSEVTGIPFDTIAEDPDLRRKIVEGNQTAGAIMSTTATKKATGNGSIMLQTWERVSGPGEAAEAPAAAAPPPPAAPSGTSEADIRAAGWSPNPNDPSGQYWYHPSGGDQRTLADLMGGL